MWCGQSKSMRCNTCNKEFDNAADKTLHYKSEWHRYNLKLKVDGIEGISEYHFLATQFALVEEENKLDKAPLLYTCGLCCKCYKSPNTYAQHLTSKTHALQLIQAFRKDNPQTEDAIVRPLVRWDIVDEAADSLASLNINRQPEPAIDVEEDYDDEFDPTCCFMCDLHNPTIDACLRHMQKKHGFLIPGIQYLKDPKGLLTYLAFQVRRYFLCLYCSERCHPFSSLEAVRKHMEAKGHFKVRYGEGAVDENVELEQFYDFSSRFVNRDGGELVAKKGGSDVEFGCGGYELILKIKRTADDGVSSKILGHREFAHYYKQSPHIERANPRRTKPDYLSRFNCKGLSPMQAKKVPALQMSMYKYMRRCGKDAMMLNVSLKSNKVLALNSNSEQWNFR